MQTNPTDMFNRYVIAYKNEPGVKSDAVAALFSTFAVAAAYGHPLESVREELIELESETPINETYGKICSSFVSGLRPNYVNNYSRLEKEINRELIEAEYSSPSVQFIDWGICNGDKDFSTVPDSHFRLIRGTFDHMSAVHSTLGEPSATLMASVSSLVGYSTFHSTDPELGVAAYLRCPHNLNDAAQFAYQEGCRRKADVDEFMHMFQSGRQ